RGPVRAARPHRRRMASVARAISARARGDEGGAGRAPLASALRRAGALGLIGPTGAAMSLDDGIRIAPYGHAMRSQVAALICSEYGGSPEEARAAVGRFYDHPLPRERCQRLT